MLRAAGRPQLQWLGLTISQERRIPDRVKRLHVTQDSSGFWLLSVEEEDGSLKLLAHQFPSRELLLHEANTLAAQGHLQGSEVVADPPQQVAESLAPQAGAAQYVRPQPKRARGT
jgi:hypothetical protein